MVTTLLSPADSERIRDAVAAVETRSSAEFVVVVTPASDGYALYPLVWAALVALLAGGLFAFLVPTWGARTIFAVQAVVFLVAVFVLEWPDLRRFLVPGRVKRAHASQLARLQFAARVEGRTEARTGLLLFVSLAERHVEIIADAGIHARAGDSAWQSVIGKFRAAVARGQLVDGFIAAIAAIGELLATHAPRSPTDRNELPDQPVEIPPPRR
jgi:putative membrane protein